MSLPASPRGAARPDAPAPVASLPLSRHWNPPQDDIDWDAVEAAGRLGFETDCERDCERVRPEVRAVLFLNLVWLPPLDLVFYGVRFDVDPFGTADHWIEADPADWPSWTLTGLEALDLDLAAFDGLEAFEEDGTKTDATA